MMKLLLVSSLLLLVCQRAYPQDKLSEEAKAEWIASHNEWRKDVGIQTSLVWSDELEAWALDWGLQLKEKCDFKHRENNKYGENLFKGTAGYYNPTDVVDAWASEKKDYNYRRNKCSPNKVCGHYTQIVWKNTTEVGCATVSCDGYDIWVCNYNPPGNWVGEYPY